MSYLERHAQTIQRPPASQNRLPLLSGQGEEMDDLGLGQPSGKMIPPEILPVQLLHDSPLSRVRIHIARVYSKNLGCEEKQWVSPETETLTQQNQQLA